MDSYGRDVKENPAGSNDYLHDVKEENGVQFYITNVMEWLDESKSNILKQDYLSWWVELGP